MKGLIKLTIMAAASVPAAVFSQCPVDQIKIPILFEFQNPEMRTDWVYRSLEAGLSIPGAYVVDRRIRESGAMEVDFCISRKDVPPPNSKFSVFFGPRGFVVAARPVRNGQMPTITFSDQPDPDWLIVRRALWLINSQGFPRIDLEIYNFGRSSHPGIDILFKFKSGGCDMVVAGVCEGCPEVTVDISISSGVLDVKAGDPQFRELIRQWAMVDADQCGNLRVSARLGSTGPISSKEARLIRYTFNQKPGPPGRKLPSSIRALTVGDILLFRHRSLFPEGPRVFPHEIEIEEPGSPK